MTIYHFPYFKQRTMLLCSCLFCAFIIRTNQDINFRNVYPHTIQILLLLHEERHNRIVHTYHLKICISEIYETEYVDKT